MEKYRESITEAIENIVRSTGLTYMDAVIYYCDKYNIEIDAVGAMIAKSQPNMKAKIEIEAENLNFIEKTARLPI